MPNFVVFDFTVRYKFKVVLKDFRDFLFGGVLFRCNLLVIVIENRQPNFRDPRAIALSLRLYF